MSMLVFVFVCLCVPSTTGQHEYELMSSEVPGRREGEAADIESLSMKFGLPLFVQAGRLTEQVVLLLLFFLCEYNTHLEWTVLLLTCRQADSLHHHHCLSC